MPMGAPSIGEAGVSAPSFGGSGTSPRAFSLCVPGRTVWSGLRMSAKALWMRSLARDSQLDGYINVRRAGRTERLSSNCETTGEARGAHRRARLRINGVRSIMTAGQKEKEEQRGELVAKAASASTSISLRSNCLADVFQACTLPLFSATRLSPVQLCLCGILDEAKHPNTVSHVTSCCSSVVERGIAVSAVILRSVVRPSVAASLFVRSTRLDRM